MKKIHLILITLIFLQNFTFGQDYKEFQDYDLTKIEYSEFIKLESENNDFDGYISIFLKNKLGEKLKEIKVYAESYENDGIVQVKESTNLKNVKEIIRVEISQCACYCNTSIYFWLITEEGKWIELPKIDEEDYEFEMKYKDYVFSINNPNEIQLLEYQDEFTSKDTFDKVRRKSEEVLKSFYWDGNRISEK